jgi:hypothetical protein
MAVLHYRYKHRLAVDVSALVTVPGLPWDARVGPGGRDIALGCACLSTRRTFDTSRNAWGRPAYRRTVYRERLPCTPSPTSVSVPSSTTPFDGAAFGEDGKKYSRCPGSSGAKRGRSEHEYCGTNAELNAMHCPTPLLGWASPDVRSKAPEISSTRLSFALLRLCRTMSRHAVLFLVGVKSAPQILD